MLTLALEWDRGQDGRDVVAPAAWPSRACLLVASGRCLLALGDCGCRDLVAQTSIKYDMVSWSDHNTFARFLETKVTAVTTLKTPKEEHDMTTFAENPNLDDYWHVVGETDDLVDGPLAVRLLGVDYVVWQANGNSLAAAPDRCPHRESPLSIGTVANGVLTCPYHGWDFGEGGKCVRIPSNAEEGRIPPAAHLQTVLADARYGLIWLCPGTPSSPIPEIPHETEAAFRRINTGVEVWTTSATRMADNFLDISHFPWVHTGTFGRAQDVLVPKLELQELDNDWFGYAYEVDAGNPDEAQLASASDDDTIHRWMTTGFQLPFVVRSTIRYGSGLEHILLLVSTPIDAETSYFTFVVWRNDDFSTDAQEAIEFDRAIGAEDKRMLEQVPGVLNLSQTGLANVQSDKASVEWRRRLVEMLDR